MPGSVHRIAPLSSCGLCIVAANLYGCAANANRSQTLQTVEPPAASLSKPLELRDNFEGPSLQEFWLPGDYGSGRYAPGAIVLSDTYARSGSQSAQITLREGEVAQVGGSGQPNERAELDSGKQPLLGRDVWYGFSFLIPPDFPIVDVRLVFAQWKQSGLEGSPIVAQRYVAGRHHVTIRDLRTLGRWQATYDLPDIVPGKWHDMVYHIRFDTDSSGIVEVWMNGKHGARFDGTTASPQGKAQFYNKVGLYRDRMAEPMTIYFDNYAVGENFEAVNPAQPQSPEPISRLTEPRP